jgi:hypothetical protein
VIVNRDPTGQDDLADAAIHASIGQTLAAIDEALDSLQESEEPAKPGS